MDEEMDGVAAEQRERLENIEAELIEVRRRLDRVWHVIENSELDIIRRHLPHQRAPGASGEAGDRRRGGQGIALRAPGRAGQRGHHRRLRRGHERLPDDPAKITESRAFIKSFVKSFVKEIKVKPGKATVYYTWRRPGSALFVIKMRLRAL